MTVGPGGPTSFKTFTAPGRREKAAELHEAAAITGIDADLIQAAAEMIAKPREDGSRPKTSFMLEKGNYWSNNYMNTASLAGVALICGSGNRPGQVVSRGGGHQRGGMGAGGGKGWLSPEKYPGRRKKSLNVDRWVMDGKVFAPYGHGARPGDVCRGGLCAGSAAGFH